MSRHKSNSTACIYGHEYTPENTGLRKDGRRRCRACDRDGARQRKMRIGFIPKSHVTHGQAARKALTAEYVAWRNMKGRCLNPKHRLYRLYGGRGIGICKRWLNSFENFFTDMGERPSAKHSIDRFPNKNGNYEPENCRWATWTEQGRNKRTNRLLTVGQDTRCLAEWSEVTGLSVTVIGYRVETGMAPELAVSLPSGSFKRPNGQVRSGG